LPRQGAIAVAGRGTTPAIRRLLHEHPDAIATTTTTLDRHGFGGLLLAAAGVRSLAALARAAKSVRPLTLALDTGGTRFGAPPVSFLRQLRRHPGLLVYACDDFDGDGLGIPRTGRPAWPPAELARIVLVANLQGLGMSLHEVASRAAAFAPLPRERVDGRHYAAMLSAYLDRCPPSTAISVLLTGVTPSRASIARELAAHVVAHVRGRHPPLRDPQVAVRVAATLDVDEGAFEVLATSVDRRSRAALHGVCAVLLPADTSHPAAAPARTAAAASAMSGWLRARPAALVVVVSHDAPARAARAAVAAARAGIPVRVVPDSGRGPGGALRAAARAVPAGFALLIGNASSDPSLIRMLGGLGTTMRRAVLVPVRGARVTHPIFYPADLRGALGRAADAGDLLRSQAHRVVYLRVDGDALANRDRVS